MKANQNYRKLNPKFLKKKVMRTRGIEVLKPIVRR